MYKFLILACLLLVEASDHNSHKKCADILNVANEDVTGSRDLNMNSHFCLTRPRKFTEHKESVENLMLKEITHSYELLLMSHQFGTDRKDRPGFKKYFESLSDNSWENAIKMAKYINRRGSSLSVIRDKGVKIPFDYPIYIGEELASLGGAMDLEQKVIHDLHEMHNQARQPELSDPDLAKHTEAMLKEELSDARTLAGYITNLNAMYNKTERGLAIFHFDQMLLSA